VTRSLRLTAAHLSPVLAGLVVILALTGCAPTTTGASSSRASTPASAAPAASPSAAGTNTTLDSCSVVTQAEVETAFGAPVQPGVKGKATVEGGVACVYYGLGVPAGTDPDVARVNSVRVVLVTGSDATTWFNDYKSKVPAVALTSLGDQAYWDGSASVSVLKGDEYLRVAVVPLTGPSESGAQTLAASALARM